MWALAWQAVKLMFGGPLMDTIQGFITGKQNARKRSQELKRAKVEAKQERKARKQEAEIILQKTGLEETGIGLKWASFAVLHYPWAHFLYYHPETNPLQFLSTGPGWYTSVLVGAHGTIWGLAIRDRLKR